MIAMDGKNHRVESPYRMSQLMDLSAKLTKTMVSSVWHLTFDEMEYVLDGIRHGIEKSKEEKDVPE